MTTTPNPSPRHQPNPETDDALAAPLYSDTTQCGCGATADPDGRCRKCRARATWDRRQSNRDRHAPTPRKPGRRPSSRRTTDPDSSRPRGRRPGR